MDFSAPPSATEGMNMLSRFGMSLTLHFPCRSLTTAVTQLQVTRHQNFVRDLVDS